MGSVKDLEGKNREEMPDHIPYKGAALCIMGAWNFKRLEEQGARTHYRGVLDNGRLYKTTDLKRI